jgi:two-component system copper resistance phosphate regulon response regulator CusR
MDGWMDGSRNGSNDGRQIQPAATLTSDALRKTNGKMTNSSSRQAPAALRITRMKLLVIEDEIKLAEYLRKGLSEEGYVVDLAHDGIDGLHLATEGDYDLVLLDSMLPGIDGLAVLAALRQSKPTPVLMLTARAQIEDRVKGLQSGADDYLVKPFAFSELVARIQVLLRRANPQRSSAEPSTFTLADLELDLIRRKAQRAGQRLDLTTKEFNLLSLLLRRQGQVISRTELAEQVWDMNFDSGTNVVEVAVRRLRSKLDQPFERPLLHTVRGMGYVLEARD